MRSSVPFLAVLAGSASATVLRNAWLNNKDMTDWGALVESSGLYDMLDGLQHLTMFAPTNEALQGSNLSGDELNAMIKFLTINGTSIKGPGAIPMNGTVYHTLLDDPQYENVTGSQVISLGRNGSTLEVYGADGQRALVGQSVRYSRGVVHLIDSLLAIPYSVGRTASDIGLSAFASAASRADVVDAVNMRPNITLFAPMDAAFARVAGGMNGTDNLTTSALASLLEYHVANPALYTSSELFTDGTKFSSLEGTQLTLHQEGDAWFVNNARIIYPNILVANGVLHIVDEVLNPSSTQGPVATATAGVLAFSNVMSSAISTATPAVTLPTNTFTGYSTSHTSFTAAAATPTGAMGAAALFAAGVVYAAL